MAVGLAVLGAAAAMAWCHFLLDPSDPLYVSLPFACWFVVSTAAWSVFSLQDSALTGLRASVWIPLENAVYGVVKLGLLVVVAQTSLSDGVFTSWTLPVLALLVPVNLLLFRRLVPRHAASTADPSRARPAGADALPRGRLRRAPGRADVLDVPARAGRGSCWARRRAGSTCRRRPRSPR